MTDSSDPPITERTFDRIEQFDDRSRGYSISVLPLPRPRSYTWRCLTYLDQGSEGACVGYGIAHELAARPVEVVVNSLIARNIYHEAQKIDPWPGGSYPGASPRYEGTSVLAGVKYAQSLGYFESYRWAFGLKELIAGVGYSPAVLGLQWFEGMFTPNSNGYISPTGRSIGGHCLLCNAIDIRRERFTLHNSWGKTWGRGGECYITFADMGRLLAQGGEAVFLQNRKMFPKQPNA